MLIGHREPETRAAHILSDYFMNKDSDFNGRFMVIIAVEEV
jgi:hypothetical protein